MAKSKTPVNVDPREIFRLASAFDGASRMLKAQAKSAVPLKDNNIIQQVKKETVSLIVPQTALDVFGCELYLKCLYVIGKKSAPPFGHNLKTLYLSLAASDQARVKKIFQDTNQKDGSIPALKEFFKRNNVPFDLDDILQVLERSAEAFPEVRYIYEGTTKDGYGYFASAVRYAARMVILEHNPTWNQS